MKHCIYLLATFATFAMFAASAIPATLAFTYGAASAAQTLGIVAALSAVLVGIFLRNAIISQ